MTLNGINVFLRTLSEIINQSASVALKLVIIGLLIVIEQWADKTF